jgi:hypothetical protein
MTWSLKAKTDGLVAARRCTTKHNNTARLFEGSPRFVRSLSWQTIALHQNVALTCAERVRLSSSAAAAVPGGPPTDTEPAPKEEESPTPEEDECGAAES